MPENADTSRALAGVFDVPTLLAIQDAVDVHAATLEILGRAHPELRCDASRLRELRHVFDDATAKVIA